MNDTIFNFGSISVYGFGILSVFAFLWGAFVFYKKAVESHFEEFHILDGIVMSAFWALIVGRLFYVIFHPDIFWNHLPRIFLFSNFPGIDRWGVISGIFLGTFFTVRRAKGKIIDWFDLMVLGISAGSAVFFAGISMMAFSWIYGVCALFFALVFGYFGT